MEDTQHQPSELERSLRGLSEREIDAQTARAELATRVGQALWNPLAHLSSAAGRLLGAGLEREVRQEVELVAAAAETIHELLAQNLTLEPRPETEGLQRAVFDLQDALAPVLKAFAPRVTRRGVEFACRIASDVPPVLIGEPQILRAIVRLLLDEALRATYGEPIRLELSATASSDGDSVLELSLSGLADDPACAPGLAACARLARQLDGRLWLELEQGGHGRAVLHVRCDRVPERRRKPRSAAGAKRATVVAAPGIARDSLVADLHAQGVDVEVADALADVRDAAAGEASRTGLISEAAWDACRASGEVCIDAKDFGLIFLISSRPGRVVVPGESALGVRGVLREPVLPREWSEVLGRAALGPSRIDQDGKAPAPIECLAVLLAEGDLAQRAVARRALERLGHEVVCVDDGLGLIGLLEERPFDLVVVDLDLPVLDGVSAARLIRAREVCLGGRTPVVALAPNLDRVHHADLNEAGIDACLSIPLDADRLSWTLARLCGAHDFESGAA